MTTLRRNLVGAVVGAAALAACAPDLDQSPPTPGPRALFDPASAAIPLPNAVLQDPATGGLQLPADPADSQLTTEIKASFNLLNGWPTAFKITLPFDAPLDPATLNGDTVRLYDLGTRDQPSFTRMPPDSYYVLFNAGLTPRTAPPFEVTVLNKSPKVLSPPAEFPVGHVMMAVVTDAVRGVDGLPALSTPALELLKSSSPLVDASGHSTTFVPDADARQLEGARGKLYAPAFAALEANTAGGGVPRSSVVSHAGFGVQTNGQAVFNPTLVGRRLPLPNDISKPADAPLTATAQAELSLAYVESTASQAAHLYKSSQGQMTEVSVTVQTSATANAEGYYPLTMVPAALEPSTTYVAVLTDALQGTDGARMAASTYFALVRATVPLLDESVTPPVLQSPYLDNTLEVLVVLGKDPVAATPQDWQGARANLVTNLQMIEKLRVAYQPLFAGVQATGLARESIIELWSFTTAAQ